MENRIEWARLEAQIPQDGIEHLRGDKEFIAFVKANIKRRSATTTLWRQFSREYQSKFARQLELPDDPKTKFKPTSKSLMRHIFLAYAWLRYKPFSFVEPNAKVDKEGYLAVPNLAGSEHPWMHSYQSSINPDINGVVKVIEWYESFYRAAKEEHCVR